MKYNIVQVIGKVIVCIYGGGNLWRGKNNRVWGIESLYNYDISGIIVTKRAKSFLRHKGTIQGNVLRVNR